MRIFFVSVYIYETASEVVNLLNRDYSFNGFSVREVLKTDLLTSHFCWCSLLLIKEMIECLHKQVREYWQIKTHEKQADVIFRSYFK